MKKNLEQVFSEIIEKNFKIFDECEKIRKQKIKEWYYDILFVIIFSIVIVYFLKAPLILAFITMPVGFIHYLIYKIHEYKIEYKKLSLPLIVQEVGIKSIIFEPNATNDKIYFKSKLFKDFTYFTISDMFERICKLNPYKITELTMYLTTAHPVFKGIVLTFPNKFAENHIIITTKGNRIASGTKKIKICNPILKKEFNIYSAKQKLLEENVYELVPNSIFELLFTLKKKYQYKKLKLAVFEDKIMLAIGIKKDLFETSSLFKSCFNINFFTKQLLKDLEPIFYIEKIINQK